MEQQKQDRETENTQNHEKTKQPGNQNPKHGDVNEEQEETEQESDTPEEEEHTNPTR